MLRVGLTPIYLPRIDTGPIVKEPRGRGILRSDLHFNLEVPFLVVLYPYIYGDFLVVPELREMVGIQDGNAFCPVPADEGKQVVEEMQGELRVLLVCKKCA